MDSLLYKLRFLVLGLCIFAVVALLVPLASAIKITSPQSAGSSSVSDTPFTNMSDNPNVVTQGFFAVMNELAGMTRSVNLTLHGDFPSIHVPLSQVADQISSGVGALGSGIGHGLAAGARGIGNSIATTLHFPVDIAGFVADSAPVDAVLHPADRSTLPVIDTSLTDAAVASAVKPGPAPVAAHPPVPAAPVAAPQSPPQPVVQPIWPIHGAITTYFGAPDPPFEAVHSGIDISDGKSPGITPVHPFKPGRVVATLSSLFSLGNHVIVDHGNGMTSVYGHMASIEVTDGETVDENTVLGYEGSTGASTGTHLHFEIRIGGQPVNPELYIDGLP